MDQIRDFLGEIDTHWTPLRSGKQNLHIIGCGALMLQTDYARGTKDSDVLQTTDLDRSASDQLLQLAGKGTSICERHRLYIDVVSNGLPFLAPRPNWLRLSRLSSGLTHFDVHVLDVVDVVVSKLKRFHANDQADVAAMIERGRVNHAELVGRFTAAMDFWQDGAHADELPKYIANLNSVERDYLLVEESQFELPSWLIE